MAGKAKKQVTDERDFEVLRLLENNPQLSQRQIASQMGISLGSVNYCLQALIEKGLIKAGNFMSNPKKSAYLYLLTPKGMAEKSRLTLAFLERKQLEYEHLQIEIEKLKEELDSDGSG